jgi:hypothetical protein
VSGPRFTRGFVFGVLVTALLYVPVHLAAFSYQLGAPTPAEYWVRSVEIAKRHAAERAATPKIALLSGSNALFGIDSGRVARTLGRPVVNLATHGGFPLHYLLDYARPVLGPGDTVVLPLELGYYSTAPRIDTWLIDQAMSWRRDWLVRRPPLERARFMLAVPSARVWTGVLYQLSSGRVLAGHPQRRLPDPDAVIREVEASWRGGDYQRRPFAYSVWNLDPHGDLVGAVGSRISSDPTPDLSTLRFTVDYGEPQWAVLREFARFCRERHIRVLMAWPVLPKAWVARIPGAAAHGLFDAITRGVRDIGLDFVDTPESSMFETRYLFDTPYHLNEEGKPLRTARLIHALTAAGVAQSQAD